MSITGGEHKTLIIFKDNEMNASELLFMVKIQT